MAKTRSCKGSLPEVRLALERSRCLPGVSAGEVMNSPEKIAAFAAEHFGCEPQERFLVFSLSSRMEILNIHEASVGALDQTSVDPRVVFAGAILSGATAIVLVHNHPSGNADPSKLDVDLTRRLVDGAKLLAIQVVDHLIVSPGGRWASMRNQGLMPTGSPGLGAYGDEEIDYGVGALGGVSASCDIGHCARCREEDCECGCHVRREKNPRSMTAGQINRELDKLDEQNSQLVDAMIAEGRGHETFSETLEKTDPLSLEYRWIVDRRAALRMEIELRYGPGAPRRLPTRGFGPRKGYGEPESLGGLVAPLPIRRR